MVGNLVCQTKGRTWAEGVGEWGVKEDIVPEGEEITRDRN